MRKIIEKIVIIGLCICALHTTAKATDLSVRILSDRHDAAMYFSTVLGAYQISDPDGKAILKIQETESVLLKVEGGNIGVYQKGNQLGVYPALSFDGEGLKAIFSLYPERNTDRQERYYDDHLEVGVEGGALFFINVVNMENYVAGVVQSEVRGISDKVDFYKIQAIISRTYAINNLRRHIKDGYYLCDEVHCQVYKSRNNTPIILTATVQTAGQVIADTGDNVITASFYSNSGGETANSEDVWKLEVPYLRSVKDTFSLGMKNTYWEKELSRKEWLGFLEKQYQYPVDNAEKVDSALNFQQSDRKAYFCNQIPLKDIRRDLNLRSAFFSVSCTGDVIKLSGKGYGHGVGLSQEGAVKMVNLGYSVEDVIRFYYTGVSIKGVDELSVDYLGD